MKVFYLFDKGFNIKYLEPFLELVDAKRVNIKDVRLGDLKGYDVLIYQTFPNESHPVKFEANIVEATDDIFKGFKGVKLLFDAHDEGNKNAYTRFAGMEPFPPVIKLFYDNGGEYANEDYVRFLPDTASPIATNAFITMLKEEVERIKPKLKSRKKRTYTRKTTKKSTKEPESKEEKEEE